jgi:hypothetical protein
VEELFMKIMYPRTAPETHRRGHPYNVLRRPRRTGGGADAGVHVASRRKAQRGSSRTVFREGKG